MLKTKKLIMMGMFVSLIIMCSFIKIPMIPVPLSLAFASVNLICLISNGKTGFISVLIYVIIGLIGVPVFSQGGGLGYIFNPTFGYIIGFLIMPVLSAFLKNIIKVDRMFLKNVLLSIVNILIVYVCGMLYAFFILTSFFSMPYNFQQFVTLFALIFIPGDMIMALVTSFLGVRLKRIVKIY